MNVELKPCPFCGGEAEMMGDQYPYVECQECAAGFTANHSYEFDEDDAASKWNARSAAGTNLKPIAESKIRQLGGDVCGVLVRKDGRLAAVDEHGRVTWLPDGTDYAAISSRAIGDIAKVTELLGVPEEEAGRPIVELVKEYLAAQSCNSAPSEQGKNRYGLDMAYFRELFNRELNRPLVDFRPDELARVLARAARTADAAVLQEPEFQAYRAQSGQGEEAIYQLKSKLGGGWDDVSKDEHDNAHESYTRRALYIHPQPAQQSVPEEAVSLARKWLGITESSLLHNDDITKMAEALLATSQPVQQGSVPEEWHYVVEVFLENVEEVTELLLAGGDADNIVALCNDLDKAATVAEKVLATPQPEADGWVECSERLPAEADGDFQGGVFFCAEGWKEPQYWHTEEIKAVAEDRPQLVATAHWKPTGLKRPQPPQEGE